MKTWRFLLGIAFLFAFVPKASANFDTIKEVKALKEQYKLVIYTDTFSGSNYANQWATWTCLDDNDYKTFKEFIIVFYEEWSKYPKKWISKNGLQGIAFVQKLNVVNQSRFAMPDAYGEILYYDIDYLRYGQRYVRDCIHHEFYHMIEEQNFGSMYYKDPKWSAFNDKDFSYGNGGASAYNSGEYVAKEHPFKGFVSTYATYGLEEDKAELYSYLFSTESYNFLIEWIKQDEILKKKFDYMKAFIAILVPEMDDTYFDKIHEKASLYIKNNSSAPATEESPSLKNIVKRKNKLGDRLK